MRCILNNPSDLKKKLLKPYVKLDAVKSLVVKTRNKIIYIYFTETNRNDTAKFLLIIKR